MQDAIRRNSKTFDRKLPWLECPTCGIHFNVTRAGVELYKKWHAHICPLGHLVYLKCVICGNLFTAKDDRGWVYYGSNYDSCFPICRGIRSKQITCRVS